MPLTDKEKKFLAAIARGNLQDIKTQLTQQTLSPFDSLERFSMRFVDEQGRTPLHWAAYYGHVDILKVLLSQANKAIYTFNGPVFLGSWLNLQDNSGQTAMHLAVSTQKLECVCELVCNPSTKKQLSIQDKNGDTPVHLAIKTSAIHRITKKASQLFNSENRSDVWDYFHRNDLVHNILNKSQQTPIDIYHSHYSSTKITLRSIERALEIKDNVKKSGCYQYAIKPVFVYVQPTSRFLRRTYKDLTFLSSLVCLLFFAMNKAIEYAKDYMPKYFATNNDSNFNINNFSSYFMLTGLILLGLTILRYALPAEDVSQKQFRSRENNHQLRL